VCISRTQPSCGNGTPLYALTNGLNTSSRIVRECVCNRSGGSTCCDQSAPASAERSFGLPRGRELAGAPSPSGPGFSARPSGSAGYSRALAGARRRRPSSSNRRHRASNRCRQYGDRELVPLQSVKRVRDKAHIKGCYCPRIGRKAQNGAIARQTSAQSCASFIPVQKVDRAD
jgi:hypothetical protein